MNSDAELAPEDFEKRERDHIFIVSSSDVACRRSAAEVAAREALTELGHPDVEVFVWDLDRGAEGLDQRRSMQKNLPRPADEHCLAVIYLVGERVGLPLEEGFDHKIIRRVEEWTSTESRFRLEPGWPDDDAAGDNLLDSGAFPLTGGIFEFLDAWGAGKPVWLCLFAEEPVSLTGPDITLNQRGWLNQRTSAMDPLARRAWEDGEYKRQTRAVHNLMRAIAAKGIEQNPIQTDGVLTAGVKAFIRRRVFGGSGDRRNPYRHLGHYDICDRAHFFGRGEFTAAVVAVLEYRFSSEQPAVVRLEGPSGCGKSSVMRAGILGDLAERKRRGQYRVLALSPEDFKDDAGQQQPVIRVILDAVKEKTDLQLPPAGISAATKSGAAAPSLAVDLLSRALARRDGPLPARLVIGLDQFEEIVDVLGGGASGEQWQPLVRFVNLAAKTPNIGIIYTLENSRRHSHDDLELGDAFHGAAEQPLDDLSTSFIDRIIDIPFRRAGFPLAPDVLTGLKKNLNAIRSENDGAGQAAVLPLLALKLTQLFDFVCERFEPRSAGIRNAFPGAAANDEPITVETLASEAEKLDFREILKRQAELAWRRSGAETVDPEELDFFLHPFVGVDSGHIHLKAVPRDMPYQHERQRAECFLEHRLMTSVGDGLVRLVHEAVIEYWPDAQRWYEARKPFLAMEARMHLRATLWDQDGRPSLSAEVKNDPALIGKAAQILMAYLRHWALDLTKVTSRDRVFYEFVATLFQFSETPQETVEAYPEPGGHHASTAASYGMIALLEKFRNIDANSIDHPTPILKDGSGGERPLSKAAWAHAGTVKYLLQYGADPTSKPQRGWPAISGAIQRGTTDAYFPIIEAARARLGHGRLEDALSCPAGQTLLHLCAMFDRVDMARNLIDRYGFSPARKTEQGWLPIHYAAYYGAPNTFDLLRSFSSSSEKTPDGNTCLHLAAGNGKTAIVDRILNSWHDDRALRERDNGGRNALHHAAAGFQSECVLALLRHIDPCVVDNAGRQPIHDLLLRANQGVDEDRLIDTLRALLADPRADPNARTALAGKTETPIALARQIPQAQRLLLEDPRTDLTAPVSEAMPTGFWVALRLGVWSAVRRHIETQGLTEGQTADDEGNTILHLLARRTAPSDLVDQELAHVSAGSINARNKRDETPLMRAMAAKNWRLAQRILDTGRVKVRFGQKPFENEILRALHPEAPENLLDAVIKIDPAIVEEPDYLGWTLLHRVCAHGQARWLERLEIHIAGRPHLWRRRDHAGRRPVDLASEALRARAPNAGDADPWPRALSWDAKITWVPLGADEIAAMAGQIRDAEGLEDGIAGANVSQGRLSFYDAPLVRIVSPKWTHLHRAFYYVRSGETPVRLDGSSPPIHGLNAMVPLKLNAANVLDYLRFFCFFVRGEEGPFLIVESADQHELPDGPSAAERTKIQRLAHPTWLIDEADGYCAAALVYYGNALFGAEFKVEKTGTVHMLDDVPLATGLSARPDRPIT